MALQDEMRKRDEADQAARDEAYLDTVWPKIRAAFPNIPLHTANKKMIVEFCGDALAVSVDAVRLCMENSDPRTGLRFKLSEPQSVADQKAELIRSILELLEGTRDAVSLDNERKRMAYGSDWTIDKLLRRRAEIEAAQAHAGKSRQQLVNEVKAQRSGFQEFEPLPAQYTPPGKPDCPVPWSKQLLAKLGETGTGKNNALRILLRKHGPNALNEAIRLAELKGAR